MFSMQCRKKLELKTTIKRMNIASYINIYTNLSTFIPLSIYNIIYIIYISSYYFIIFQNTLILSSDSSLWSDEGIKVF